MKKYFIVGFVGEKGQPVEIVPSNWIIGEECFWPSFADAKKLKTMIFKAVPPSEEWSLFPIKIYGKSNSFSKATLKVELARRESSIGLDSPDDVVKRSTRVPLRYRDTDSQSTDEELEESQSLIQTSRRKACSVLPVPPSKNNCMLGESSSNLPIAKENTPPVTRNAPSIKIPASQISVDQGSSFSNFLSQESTPQETILEKVLKHLIDIKNENKMMRHEIKNLREKVEMKLSVHENSEVVTAIGNIVNKEEFSDLPLMTLSNLQGLEDLISLDAAKATSLARFLCRGGGYSDANTLTLLVLKRLLSRNVALQYSLEGRQNKLRFSDLNLFNVVIASVKMQYPDAEISKINSRVWRVLAGSPDWDGNRVRGKRKIQEIDE